MANRVQKFLGFLETEIADTGPPNNETWKRLYEVMDHDLQELRDVLQLIGESFVKSGWWTEEERLQASHLATSGYWTGPIELYAAMIIVYQVQDYWINLRINEEMVASLGVRRQDLPEESTLTPEFFQVLVNCHRELSSNDKTLAEELDGTAFFIRRMLAEQG